jgi:hypothetical protein
VKKILMFFWALPLFAFGQSASFSDVSILSFGVAPLAITKAVPGPLSTYLSTYPNFIEFSRSNQSVKGSIGALGSFEMNMSANMDYASGTHRFYDNTKDAYWTALNINGYYLQYAPATTSSGDVWDIGGNQYGFHFSKDAAEFNGDIVPLRTGGSALGSPTKRMRQLYVDGVNTTVIGSVVINKAAGRINLAAGQTSITVTDSFATASAHIFANLANVDTTAKHAQVTPSDGYFTVSVN